jgi:hypothetical protein
MSTQKPQNTRVSLRVEELFALTQKMKRESGFEVDVLEEESAIRQR